MKKYFSFFTLIIIFITCIFMYVFSPETYSFNLNLFYLIIFILSSVVFFWYKKKINYFDFDTIFVLAYFFAFFSYPVFIHPFEAGRFFIFNYPFNEDTINKSTVLALLGIVSFFLGSMSRKTSGIQIPQISISKNNIPLYVGILFLIIFNMMKVIFPPYNIYAGEGTADPSAAGGIRGYFNLLSFIIIICAICFQFRYNIISKNKIYRNIFFLFLLAIFFFLNLKFGDRSLVLEFILIIFAYISIACGGFNLKKFIVIAFLGLTALNVLLIIRQATIAFSFNILDMALDLIIVNRNTFLAVDYVNKNGVFFIPFLGALLAGIPFLSSLVFRGFNINPLHTTSSIYFSYLTFGQNMDFGVGTNIIASLYLSLGLLGVIFGMFCLGAMVAYLMNKFYTMSYYGSFAYLILISNSVYLVRSEYFWFMRNLILGLIIYCLLLSSHYFFKIKKHNGDI